MTPTVHVLLYGSVLCGQIHGLPKDWGPQHRWVRLEERVLATCAACRDASLMMAVLIAEADRRHEQMLPPAGPDDDEAE